MAELFDTTTYQVQRVGSVVRRRERGLVYLDETGLTVLDGRYKRVIVNLAPGQVNHVQLVKVLTGKLSVFRPLNARVLRVEATTTRGPTVIGIAVPTERATEWLEAAEDLGPTGKHG